MTSNSSAGAANLEKILSWPLLPVFNRKQFRFDAFKVPSAHLRRNTVLVVFAAYLLSGTKNQLTRRVYLTYRRLSSVCRLEMGAAQLNPLTGIKPAGLRTILHKVFAWISSILRWICCPRDPLSIFWPNYYEISHIYISLWIKRANYTKQGCLEYLASGVWPCKGGQAAVLSARTVPSNQIEVINI